MSEKINQVQYPRMASSSVILFLLINLIHLRMTTSQIFKPGLPTNFYDKSCPNAVSQIKKIVFDAVQQERRMGASLLRLHFHDCFVNGCDGSILLDDIPDNFTGEKTAFPNRNSTRGYDVVDRIKAAVDSICGGPVVSCADILAVAARDSVVALGGPSWAVQLGRRDSTTASFDDANNELPSSHFNLPQITANFQNHGLTMRDMVALSGAHTIGFSRCQNYRNRIYEETNLDPQFAKTAQLTCPRTDGIRNDVLHAMDSTPLQFDSSYFQNLLERKGLLHSDQELMNDARAALLVRIYRQSQIFFATDFTRSMIKMGNLKPLTAVQGEIRVNCRKVNA